MITQPKLTEADILADLIRMSDRHPDNICWFGRWRVVYMNAMWYRVYDHRPQPPEVFDFRCDQGPLGLRPERTRQEVADFLIMWGVG